MPMWRNRQTDKFDVLRDMTDVDTPYDQAVVNQSGKAKTVRD